MKYFFEKTENISLKRKMVMNSVFLIFFIVFVFAGCSNHNSSAWNQSQTDDANNTPAASVTQLPIVTREPKVTESPTSSTTSQAILSKNKKNFEGTWNRTNVESSTQSTIEIKNVTNDGFDFSVEAFYWSHTGFFDGKAKFKSDNEAVCEVINSEIDEVVDFIISLKNNSLSIPQFDDNSLPVGMCVTIDGEYTKGEPQYTNTKNYSLIVPNKKIENIIKSKMNADDYSYFEIAAIDGYVSKVNIDGYNLYNIDTATIGGYNAHIIVTKNNMVYLWCGFSDLQFYSNDKNYSKNEIYLKAKKLIK